jgi:dihydrofolate reductase
MVTAASPSISLVVARDLNGVIGRDNALPWRLPADLRRFKTLTMGKPMLMGRRTFDSIGRPLPGRVNLVLTRDRAWQAPGTLVVHSLDEAFEKTQGAAELMVIGGAELFKLVLPLAERVYLTDVEAKLSGDTRFPELAPEQWRELECSSYVADADHAYAMTFRTLERRHT